MNDPVRLIVGEPLSLAEARARRQRPFTRAVSGDPNVAAVALLLGRVYRGHVRGRLDPASARLMKALHAGLAKLPKGERQLALLALIADVRVAAEADSAGFALDAFRGRLHIVDPAFRRAGLPPEATIREWLADSDDDAWVAAKLIHHCAAFGYSRETRVDVKRQRKVSAVERIYNVLREVRRKAERRQ